MTRQQPWKAGNLTHLLRQPVTGRDWNQELSTFWHFILGTWVVYDLCLPLLRQRLVHFIMPTASEKVKTTSPTLPSALWSLQS